jgi:hypothetical protein
VSARDRNTEILAVFRQVLGIVEAQELPVPDLSPSVVTWYLVGQPERVRREMAALEAALPCEFTGGINPKDDGHYRLTGVIGGIPVTIGARASSVAEQHVGGQRLEDVIEWRRRLAEDEAPESGEQA